MSKRFWRVEWRNQSGSISRGRVGGADYYRALARAQAINPKGEIVSLVLISN